MENYVCYQNHKYFYAASEELGSYGFDEPASCSNEDLFCSVDTIRSRADELFDSVQMLRRENFLHYVWNLWKYNDRLDQEKLLVEFHEISDVLHEFSWLVDDVSHDGCNKEGIIVSLKEYDDLFIEKLSDAKPYFGALYEYVRSEIAYIMKTFFPGYSLDKVVSVREMERAARMLEKRTSGETVSDCGLPF